MVGELFGSASRLGKAGGWATAGATGRRAREAQEGGGGWKCGFGDC